MLILFLLLSLCSCSLISDELQEVHSLSSPSEFGTSINKKQYLSVVHVAAGENRSFALFDDGSLWAWAWLVGKLS